MACKSQREVTVNPVGSLGDWLEEEDLNILVELKCRGTQYSPPLKPGPNLAPSVLIKKYDCC